MTLIIEYDGKQYRVPSLAYDLSLPIKLPDGRFVQPEYWGESCPPHPCNLRELVAPSAVINWVEATEIG